LLSLYLIEVNVSANLKTVVKFFFESVLHVSNMPPKSPSFRPNLPLFQHQSPI